MGRPKINGICQADGCAEQATHRRFCSKHYQSLRRYGDPNRPVRPKRPHGSGPGICAVEDCPKAARGKGLCSMHLSRLRRLGDPLAETRPYTKEVSPCRVEDCAEDAETYGYCAPHAYRFKKYGDPKAGPESICIICGERHEERALPDPEAPITIEWLDAYVSYYRDKAWMHLCAADCGYGAERWAYVYTDPNEGSAMDTEGRPLIYSLDSDHYKPLCIECHEELQRAFHRHLLGLIEDVRFSPMHIAAGQPRPVRTHTEAS